MHKGDLQWGLRHCLVRGTNVLACGACWLGEGWLALEMRLGWLGTCHRSLWSSSADQNPIVSLQRLNSFQGLVQLSRNSMAFKDLYGLTREFGGMDLIANYLKPKKRRRGMIETSCSATAPTWQRGPCAQAKSRPMRDILVVGIVTGWIRWWPRQRSRPTVGNTCT